MFRSLRWPVLSLFLLLVVVPIASAATDPATPGNDGSLTLGTSSSVIPATLQPAPTAPAEASLTRLQPVQIARVPSFSVTTPTLLTAGAQPIGFQSGSRNRHVQWALTGAAIGLIVGLLDDDPVENALLGGAIGLGLSFVIGR